MTRCSNTERDRVVFSAENILNAVATDLSQIKHQDRLTFGDIAAVLGKSEDAAGKYCNGQAAMDVVTFARAKREWNGRFTGSLDRLCKEHARSQHEPDRTSGSKVLKAALALSVALEDDDEISATEVRQNRATIEAAIEALQRQLDKLAPAEVRA